MKKKHEIIPGEKHEMGDIDAKFCSDCMSGSQLLARDKVKSLVLWWQRDLEPRTPTWPPKFFMHICQFCEVLKE